MSDGKLAAMCSRALQEQRGEAPFDLECRTASYYHEIFSKAVEQHGFPEKLLAHQYDRCYCGKCKSGETTKHGKPRPSGWLKIGIHTNVERFAANHVSSWNVCYHGSTVDSVFKIATLGYLLKASDTTPSGEKLAVLDGHIKKGFGRSVKPKRMNPILVRGASHAVGQLKIAEAKEDFDPTKLFFTTPSIEYADYQHVYCKPMTVDGVKLHVILELRARPNSFTIGESTVLGKIGAAWEEDELEWYTNRYMAFVLTGFMVRVDGGVPSDYVAKKVVSLTKIGSPAREYKDMFGRELKWSCPGSFVALELSRFLGIPQDIFDHRFTRCYCESCCKADRHPADCIYERGGKDYHLPKHYSRLGLRLDVAREFQGHFKDWHVCYHGTTLNAIRSILQSGVLLPPGSRDFDGYLIKAKATDVNETDICTSPLLDHAMHGSPKSTRRVNGRVYEFQVALQLMIKPDTYSESKSKLDGFTYPSHIPEGRRPPLDKLVWHTPRHGCHVLYGLLIKVNEVEA